MHFLRFHHWIRLLQLPYRQLADSEEAIDELTINPEVAALRDEYGADLVQLVGRFDDYCGVA